jgi:hypothetical protein
MKIEQAIEKMQAMFPKKYWTLEAHAFQHEGQPLEIVLKGYVEDLTHTQPRRSWEAVLVELELMAKDQATKPPTEAMNDAQTAAVAQAEATF